MARFKENSRQRLREINEGSKKTIDQGSDMNKKASEINAILKSIDLQDDEDTRAIKDTGNSYQSNFDTAFGERVERPGQEIQKQGREVSNEVGKELKNVESGMGKLEKARSISDIGQAAASEGRSRLDKSRQEYSGIINEVDGISEQTKREIESLRSNLKNAFR